MCCLEVQGHRGGLDPLEQSGDPDKDSKVATFQRDTLRMETMQRVSR